MRIKRNLEKYPYPRTYEQSMQFLYDWYNHLKLDNLPQSILRYMRHFAFFDKTITHPQKGKPYTLADAPTVPIKQKEKHPTLTTPLDVYFQSYMQRIAHRLYAANKDILGEMPEFIFRLNYKKNNIYPAAIKQKTEPNVIIFNIHEFGRSFQTEDQLATVMAHELIHHKISSKIRDGYIMRTEEALCDLLGTLISARASYRPSQYILYLGDTTPKNYLLFADVFKKIIPKNLSPEEIICLAELAEFNHLKIPPEKEYLFNNSKLADYAQAQYPHPVTRMIYTHYMNELFYNVGILHENDPHVNGRPIDKKLMREIEKYKRNKTLSRITKHPTKRYISHRANPRNKEKTKQ